MPRKLRQSKRRASVNIRRFLADGAVGPCPYFGTPGYETEDEAYEAWEEVRRDVWAVTHRMGVPKAAAVYDGLTSDAVKAMWACTGWSAVAAEMFARVPDAINRDRDNVRRFRAENPAGAKVIRDFLDLFLVDVSNIERAYEQFLPGLSVTSSSWHQTLPLYGQAA